MIDLGIEILLWLTYFFSLYFSIFFLLVFIDYYSFFKKEKKNKDCFRLKKFPLVSVLIPAYNEEKTIIQTIKSVLNLDYPKDKLEIIVINDGSTDNTEKKVKTFLKKLPREYSLKLISHPNCGKAASLNKALKIARGEFFACLDADSFVEKKTLKKMLQLYYSSKDPSLAIVTPAMKVKQPKKILQRIQGIEYLLMIFISRLSSQIDSLYVAPGPFSLYRTEIIKKLGGFDEDSLTEDQEIAYRAQKHNYRIKQCFDGYVYTLAPASLRAFYKQRRRWYLGSLACLRKYRSLVFNKKYGDFGLIQLTKNVLGFLLAFTGFSFFFYFFFIPIYQKLKVFYFLDFDLLYFLRKFKLRFNFLFLDFRKVVLVFSLVFLSVLFFYLAHRNAQEKINKYGILPILPYFAFYYLFKGSILIFSLLSLLLKRKIDW